MSTKRLATLAVAAAVWAVCCAGVGAQGVTITWWNPDAGTMDATYAELIDKFEELNPDINVDIVAISEAEFLDKLLLAMTSGSAAPDVFTFYFSADFPRHGFLEDLTPYFRRDGLQPEEVWFPIGVSRIQYNGRYWGVPRDVGPSALGYNTDMFDAYGLTYPGENFTLDDFEEDIRRLNRPDQGTYGLDATLRGVGALEWTALAANLGVELVSENGAQSVGYLDSERTLDVFEWWAGLHLQGYTQPQGSDLALWSGDVGFGGISMWEIATLRDAVGLNWDLHPGPVSPDGQQRAWADAVMHYMYSGSEHKEAAWKLLKWVSTSVEAGGIIAKHLHWAPPMVDAWLEYGLDRDPILSRMWRIAQYPAETPNYLRTEYQWTIVQPEIESAWDQAVVQNQGSIRVLLEEAARTIQQKLDEAYSN